MSLCVLVYCVIAVVTTTATEQTESLVVRTDSGPVRGYKDPNEDIFVFYGIPYAKAPSGSDRFKAPLPPSTWIEPLEAIEKGVVCPQNNYYGLISEVMIMQENCLIANVYVPNTDKSNISVVVYVHGGGFMVGYGNMITPKKIVESEEIIVVTFNYRLGAHGFLCLGTEDVPGNAGMKDQLALLRWIKNNIVNFGGNPNDVTIAGYSGGSASVDLLALSKPADGLFRKVILESGANLSPFSVQVNPVENAKEYGKLLKFYEDDMQALEAFYKNAPYELLQSGYAFNRTDSVYLTAPCVEQESSEVQFLSDSPFNILKSGDFNKYPMLYGFSKMEGLVKIPDFDQWKDEINTKFADFLPADLQFKSKEEKEEVANKIKMFYFKDKPIDDQNILAYVDYQSDIVFTCPTLRSINLQVKAGNDKIFLYEYSFVEDSTPFVPHTTIRGTGHSFQTTAVLDGSQFLVSDESAISEDLRQMKSLMRELWSRFAKFGRPESSEVPTWLPVGDNWSPYMELKKNPEVKNNLLLERCSFWQEIYDKHYNIPIPPHMPQKRVDL